MSHKGLKHIACFCRFGAILVLLQCIFVHSSTYACASCGSGGDDPLILYPNEHVKLYGALARTSAYRLISTDGSALREGGVETKTALVYAAGFGISTRVFTTLTHSWIRNDSNARSISGFGDPLLSLRYSVLMPDMDEVFLPQIQLIGAFKPGAAKSIYQSTDDDQLDVFGTGFAEARGGADFWWGMATEVPLRFGFAYTMAKPLSRSYYGMSIEPGQIERSVVSLGYGFDPYGKIVLGVSRERKAPIRTEGEVAADSESQVHGVFVTVDGKFDDLRMLRLTASRAAAFGRNRNTTGSSTLTMAYWETLW